MILAIGDIHGCDTALKTMLDTVQPTTDDTIITLGDYVDRGPDSKAVIQILLDFRTTHQLIHLMGNHEIQMIRALEAKHHMQRFLDPMCGGQDTLDNYGGSFKNIPDDHWEFITSAKLYHETDTHLFVHAGLEDLPTNTGHAICLDTCAYGGGWLTALDVESGTCWQTNERGQSRTIEI